MLSEISDTVSMDIDPSDQTQMILSYSRQNIIEFYNDFFSRRFFLAYANLVNSIGSTHVPIDQINHLHDTVEETNDATSKIIDEIIQSDKRILSFVSTLNQFQELDSQMIGTKFSETYNPINRFSNDIHFYLKLVLMESQKSMNSDKKVNSPFSLIYKSIEEINDYRTLLIAEVLRLDKIFMPKVHEQVFGDLYR